MHAPHGLIGGLRGSNRLMAALQGQSVTPLRRTSRRVLSIARVSRSLLHPLHWVPRATTFWRVRRSWLWLALSLILVPAFGIADPADPLMAVDTVAFLDTVGVQTHARETLASSATLSALGLIPPLPIVFDPKETVPIVSSRSPMRGTMASLVPSAGGSNEPVVTVTGGQTLWGIAHSHGVTVELLAAANGLSETHMLTVGQQLIIPADPSGQGPALEAAIPLFAVPRGSQQVTVRVREGETLWEIARSFGVSVDSLVDANGLADGESVHTGQRLTIPGGALDVLRRVTALGGEASIAQTFVWPARGQLSSRFGWRVYGHHNGIDIAAPRGAPICAAKGGLIVFAGWFFGYGQTVVIDHGTGISTVYGHASKILVTIGEVVEAGQVIALVGSTGAATGPHLHFEIRVRGRPLNPMKYL